MARSKETFNKREKEKKRIKQRQEKREKMEERKARAEKGKPLHEMMAYIDENGNLSTVPPDPKLKRVFVAEEIEIGVPKATAVDEENGTTGHVDYFNQSKGFGFIIDAGGERLFFHVNGLTEAVAERDRVSFEVERGPRGLSAVNVRKL